MAQRLAIILSALLVPSLALAQITITESNDTDKFINTAECNNTEQDGLSFTWTFPGFVAGGTYTLTASDTSGCPLSTTTTAVNNVTINANIPATSASGSFPSSGTTGVPGLMQQLQFPCSSAESAIFFCVTLSSASSATAVTGSITLDLLKPPAPQATSADPGDSSLTVNWNPGSGGSVDAGAGGSSDSWVITAVNQADPNDRHATGRVSGNGLRSNRIGGLKNGVTYDVTVQAFSPGGNPSDASNIITGTPVPVNDFWRIYKNEGGRESGGCAAGAAGMLALLAVPLALRAWRRRP